MTTAHKTRRCYRSPHSRPHTRRRMKGQQKHKTREIEREIDKRGSDLITVSLQMKANHFKTIKLMIIHLKRNSTLEISDEQVLWVITCSSYGYVSIHVRRTIKRHRKSRKWPRTGHRSDIDIGIINISRRVHFQLANLPHFNNFYKIDRLSQRLETKTVL